MTQYALPARHSTRTASLAAHAMLVKVFPEGRPLVHPPSVRDELMLTVLRNGKCRLASVIIRSSVFWYIWCMVCLLNINCLKGVCTTNFSYLCILQFDMILSCKSSKWVKPIKMSSCSKDNGWLLVIMSCHVQLTLKR